MFWFLLLVVVVIAGWVITMFNGLVILKNRVNEAESDIDVQLKRRHDLIPNLINTVKGYATHERELLESVTRARSEAMNAQGMEAKAKSENMLSDTLKSLFAVAENYPELKANQNFLALQEELSDTENKIMSSRRFYNTNVRDYNIRTEVFPTSIIAGWFKFMKRELFELDEEQEKAVPDVDFSKDAPQTPTPSVEPVAPTPPAEEATADGGVPQDAVKKSEPPTTPPHHEESATPPTPPTPQAPQSDEQATPSVEETKPEASQPSVEPSQTQSKAEGETPSEPETSSDDETTQQ